MPAPFPESLIKTHNMKKRTVRLLSFLLGIAVLLSAVISGCNKQVDYTRTGKALQSTIKQDLHENYEGQTYIRVTTNNEILVGLSTAGNDTVDHVFVLSVDKKDKISLTEGNLGYSTIYYYKDQRAILLHTKASNQIYFLGLKETASQDKIDSLASQKDLKASFQSGEFGFGLSAIRGKWSASIISDATKKYASNLLTIADLQTRYTTSQKIAASADDAPVSCTSGGPGATSCSITEGAIIPNTCSVTCANGYFACCQSSTTRCTCYLAGTPVASGPTSPKWGQCGGTGWTGPNICEAGSTCVRINDAYYQCQ